MDDIQKKCGFAERLCILRKKCGLSRADFAKKLNLTNPSQISRYESGKSFPNIPALEKIAEVLNADLHWLITGNPTPSNAQQDKNYQRIFADLGEQVSKNIASLLAERDTMDDKMYKLRKRIELSEDSERELLDSEQMGIFMKKIAIEQRLSDMVKIQSEIQKAFAELLNKNSPVISDKI